MSRGRERLSTVHQARIKQVLPAFEELAGQIASRWRRSRYEDVYAAGTLRLTEVAPDFNPAIQEEFKAFAYPHVRGAMLREALKTVTFQGREKAMIAMDLRDGPVDPAGRDLLANMMTPDPGPSSKTELRQYLALRAAGLYLAGVAATKPETSEDEVVDHVDRKKAKAVLEEAVAALDARGKHLVDLLYYQQVTVEEAAKLLGDARGKPYTTRHVSRLHEQVRARLARALRRAGITTAFEDDTDDTEE